MNFGQQSEDVHESLKPDQSNKKGKKISLHNECIMYVQMHGCGVAQRDGASAGPARGAAGAATGRGAAGGGPGARPDRRAGCRARGQGPPHACLPRRAVRTGYVLLSQGSLQRHFKGYFYSH